MMWQIILAPDCPMHELDGERRKRHVILSVHIDEDGPEDAAREFDVRFLQVLAANVEERGVKESDERTSV